jgi:predicted RNase H-like nuclease (RuvC/YqgF family)
MAHNLQDQNQALENASKLQQQKIAYLESHLRDAHGKMAALESRLKESEETAWVIDQNQAASSLQQQKIDSLESQLQIAHETIVAFRESEKMNRAIDTDLVSQTAKSVQFGNSWHEQEITLPKIQNSQLLEILKDAVRTRK